MNCYSNIRKILSISKDERFEVKLFTDSPEKYKYLQEYFGYINHHIVYLGNAKPQHQENDVVFAVYDGESFLMASIEMNAARVVKYKTVVDEKVMWLKKEIDFLSNRLNGFNSKTPEYMIEEVRKKLENYKRDLKFFEDNYGDTSI